MSTNYPPNDAQPSADGYPDGYPEGTPTAPPVVTPRTWPTQPGAQAGSASTIGSAFSGAVATLGRNYLIVLGGSLVAILAFFVLPYVSASVQATNSIVSPVLDGLCGPSHCDYSFTAAQTLANDGMLLLVPLLAVVAAVVVILAALRALPLSVLTTRNAAIVAAAGGVLGLLVLVQQFFVANSLVAQWLEIGDTLTGLVGIHIAVGLGAGFWLMTLGMLAVVVGAVLELSRPSAS